MLKEEQLPRRKIFSLSLADDTFRTILGPDVDVTLFYCYNLLCEVEGSLCSIHLDRNDKTMMNLWLLQDSDKQLWVKQQIRLQFSIELNLVSANSITIQTSETEISVKVYHEGNFYSCLYDKQGRLLKENKVIELQSAPWRVADVDTHVESLLSLSYAGTYVQCIKAIKS
ncbi:hypothetical protein FRX31_002290 [Thalictrum thalictroides]|uniref:F-box associated domain-containing protein n=1 Tax=Thalictrum thalictroides TaxID=46969 RepID=A0A7J6XHB9_THATH|nr:hypothetical protein FRX31_002290 [Thalictrum thalictroides]